jgi:LPXTG-motif cell wall-anchored protein
MRRQILSRSLLTVAAASSILAVTGGIASADSDTGARNTPGHSADDQAAAQTAQGGQDGRRGQYGQGAQDDSAAGSRSSGAGASGMSGATAEGRAEGSPGVLSGNNLSAPVDVPVNVCGNSVDVVGLLNPTFGNHCANGAAPAPEAPPQQDTPPPAPPKANPPEVHTQLAETGTSGGMVGTAAGAGAVMLLGGAMLYRRSTRAARVRRTHS